MYRLGNQLMRQKLVQIMEPTDKAKKCELVYGIKCADCSASYVGETKQALVSRLKQHQRASTNENQVSAVYKHISDTGHSFDDKDVVILDREQRWFERGVCEAIYERIENPSINKKGGLRFSLSKTWDRPLQNVQRCLSHDCSPSRHQVSV